MAAMLAPGPNVPPGVAWRGLAASGLGALMAGLASQAHGLAQTDIGGALGISADDASWIVTAGTVAEGAAVMIASPLTTAFGIRRIIVAATFLTAALAGLVLQTQDLGTAIVLRFVEGFATGLLPVVMMGWALRAFAPARRGLPLMLFAFASSAPSAFAALVTGVATSSLGGRGVFVFDLAWTPVVLVVALLLTPREPLQVGKLASLDWLGYALFASGVMLFLTLLSQGERRFWLATDWIAPLWAGSIALLCAGIVRFLTAKNPYFDLKLLLKPTFAIGLSEAFSLRFALLMASFAIPQALARLHQFRVEQAGVTILWLGAAQAVGFPIAYLWIARRDARWTLAAGLVLFAAASLAAALIDPSWEGDQFLPILLLAGVGQGFYLTSVMTFATWNVPPPAGATAAGLFNITRVIGTAGATAAVGYWLRIRENFHSARLTEAATAANPAVDARISQLTQQYAGIGSDPAAAQVHAMSTLDATYALQSYALAFSDVFVSIAAILAGFALLVPLLPRLPSFSEPNA